MIIDINLFLITVIIGVSIMYIYAPKPEIIIKCPAEQKNKRCF